MTLKYSKNRARSKPITICTWDTETDNLNGALLCISFSTPFEEGVFTGPNMVRDFMRIVDHYEYPNVWFAHNAQYDWRYILDAMLEYEDIEFLSRTERDIFEIRLYDDKKSGDHIKDRKIRQYHFRDSFALFSFKLEDFVSLFGDIRKMQFDHEAGFDPNNEEHLEYALNDACALRSALNDFYEKWYASFGVYPSATKAGSALRAWQHTLEDVEYFPINEKAEAFIRHAYYGGLVFMTSNCVFEDCLTYDVSSSYPYQMLENGVPCGPAIAVDFYKPGMPGFYYVRVRTPHELVIPIIPMRENDAIAWRRGEFDTYVSSIELEFAADHGYEILAVYSGYVFETIEFPFGNFIRKCMKLRKENPEIDDIKNPINLNAKDAQNSLYGKFGTRQERNRVLYCKDGDVPKGAYPTEIPNIFTIKECAEIMTLPHWAAWITANARIHLLRAAYSAGVEHVIYGDTDSLTLLPGADFGALNIGDEYGQFKLEKVWKQFRATAPKVYSGLREKKGELVLSGKAKGIPKRILRDHPELYGKLLAGEQIEVDYVTVPSFYSILTGKGNHSDGTQPARRKSTDIANSRSWEIEGGRVRAKKAG